MIRRRLGERDEVKHREHAGAIYLNVARHDSGPAAVLVHSPARVAASGGHAGGAGGWLQ